IEVAVTDAQADEVVEAIVKAAGTGKIGDGKVFVYDLGSVVRIRTGEIDADAL
ncbi:MAG: P-II family nitrogen regulator, partial [Stenotrophomonas acidaminiphila]|nr:P-II family nitrogen regulator [Stenotrophomonas acidaminiphila]